MGVLSSTLQSFAEQQQLLGVSAHTLKAIQQNKPGYSVQKGQQFMRFYQRIKKELLLHPVITNNEFTAWFNHGLFTPNQLKMFIVQFSVFSNLFIVAQLLKTINADSLDAMHASKEILVNELGVVFNSKYKTTESDSEMVAEEGTVEGGAFHFQAAHFEWLFKLAEKLGLAFNDIGKRKHGTESTLFFCDELSRLYANEDYTISQASSFAVENWAAAGFWKELICGLEIYQKTQKIDFPHFLFYLSRQN